MFLHAWNTSTTCFSLGCLIVISPFRCILTKLEEPFLKCILYVSNSQYHGPWKSQQVSSSYILGLTTSRLPISYVVLGKLDKVVWKKNLKIFQNFHYLKDWLISGIFDFILHYKPSKNSGSSNQPKHIQIFWSWIENRLTSYINLGKLITF